MPNDVTVYLEEEEEEEEEEKEEEEELALFVAAWSMFLSL